MAEKGSIQPNAGTEVTIDGKRIAIFNADKLYALDAMCAHQNQSIACGTIDGDVVECPHHFWHYNIKTGSLLDYLRDVKLQTYLVEEKSDGIYVSI